jgi:hypothetical protein
VQTCRVASRPVENRRRIHVPRQSERPTEYHTKTDHCLAADADHDGARMVAFQRVPVLELPISKSIKPGQQR